MELFNSVGIEIEIENVTTNNLPGLGGIKFRINRDASCESDGYTIHGIKVNIEESDINLLEYLPIKRETYGCELVTAGVLDTSNLDYLYKLKKLTNLLISKGESNRSYRAGFHVHINVAYNLQILKSILRLSRHLEQVLYLLGGMGYDYRGYKNHSAYCRPITKYGPVCVRTGWGVYSQVFTISDLLKTKSTEEFKTKYGNVDRLRGSHYIPIRYHGVNLTSLFTQGSLEFRMFNKSLNPYYLMAIIEFCKAVSSYAVQSSFKTLKEENLLKENSIFSVKGEQDRENILKTFTHFLELSNLENREVIDTLYEILQTSSVESLVTPDNYVFTHLMFHRQGGRSPTHWENREYQPKVIDESRIREPNFEDVHVLRERRDRNSQRIGSKYGQMRRRTENLKGPSLGRTEYGTNPANTGRWDADTTSTVVRPVRFNNANIPEGVFFNAMPPARGIDGPTEDRIQRRLNEQGREEELIYRGDIVYAPQRGIAMRKMARFRQDSYPNENATDFFDRIAEEIRETFDGIQAEEQRQQAEAMEEVERARRRRVTRIEELLETQPDQGDD
jgi:hypothetical protein